MRQNATSQNVNNILKPANHGNKNNVKEVRESTVPLTTSLMVLFVQYGSMIYRPNAGDRRAQLGQIQMSILDYEVGETVQASDDSLPKSHLFLLGTTKA